MKNNQTLVVSTSRLKLMNQRHVPERARTIDEHTMSMTLKQVDKIVRMNKIDLLDSFHSHSLGDDVERHIMSEDGTLSVIAGHKTTTRSWGEN